MTGRRPRVVVASIIQESNTFSPVSGRLSDFESRMLARGAAARDDELLNARTEIGGFVAVGSARGWTVEPLLIGWAPSAGAMVEEDYAALERMLLEELAAARAAGPVDGALIATHGAWVGSATDDLDGRLLAAVRSALGDEVPVVATLDLHANLTREMVDSTTALIGYRTYPHTDMYETGERAAELLAATLAGEVRPAMAWRRIPMVVAPENARSDVGPLAEVLDLARELEAGERCALASVLTVQPWIDVPEFGSSVLVVTDDDRDLAQSIADRVADALWERRHEFAVTLHSAQEAVELAARLEGPVVIVDSADGVSSGSTGDSTLVLGALLASAGDRRSLVTIVDPEASRRALEADGEPITLTVGGRRDSRNAPLELTATVRQVEDSTVHFSGGIHDGTSVDMGAAAVLDVGRTSVLVMEHPVPCYDPALYRCAGLEPGDADIVVVKSPTAFRAPYGELSRHTIYVDGVGSASPRLDRVPYKRVPRPLFPLDALEWSAASDDKTSGGVSGA